VPGPNQGLALVKVCVTGATGFVGAHVASALVGRGDDVRVTYRSRSRLTRLGGIECEPVRADILDRASMRRAMRGVEVAFHTAGLVASRPVEDVFRMNAVAPRIAVEAAAAEGVRRVVVTSSVAALGPAREGEVADERQVYRGGLGLTYADAKHEGEQEALAAGERHGVEVVVVNPSYVLGVPVDANQPGETSTRTVGNYLLGRLPMIVAGASNFVDVRDVARGHLLAADDGTPGERYVLGGHNLTWPEFIDRLARLSRIHRRVVVLPAELTGPARLLDGLPGPNLGEGAYLMGQNWRVSSRRARRELDYSARPLSETLRATIDWYRDLISAGAFDAQERSSMSVMATAVRLGERAGLLGGLELAGRVVGRRLVAGR
jgi:dihydroflavonol-4-reductase